MTTHPDRHPLCRQCLALVDPVTGISPRCGLHQGTPRPGRRSTFDADPPRLPEELARDALRFQNPAIPTAHDLRFRPLALPKGHHA